VQVKEPKPTRHLATNTRITRPYVQRKPGRSPDEHEGELPLGILLTGGEKLRAEGLTGKGIKVAVIDSGVDDTHPGFNGKVVQQQWFRWGTPLSV
jgi:subtilisin family serine protease